MIQYLTTNPGFEWQVVAGDWDFFRIILSGLWFVVYFSLFIVRYIPCLSQFSGAKSRFRSYVPFIYNTNSCSLLLLSCPVVLSCPFSPPFPSSSQSALPLSLCDGCRVADNHRFNLTPLLPHQ